MHQKHQHQRRGIHEKRLEHVYDYLHMYNESSRNADLVSEYLVATTASNRYPLVQHYIFQLHHPVCITQCASPSVHHPVCITDSVQCASPIQTSWPSDVSDLHVVSVVADVHVLAWSSPRSPVTTWLHYHEYCFSCRWIPTRLQQCPSDF